MNEPLFGPQLPTSMQAAYARDPRLAYARQLMQQGSSTAPVQSWVEGLARALQGGVGGYFAGQANEDWQARGKSYNDAIAKALAGGDPGAIADGLLANPDTAEMGASYKMQNVQRAADRADASKTRQEEWDHQRTARMEDWQRQREIALASRPPERPFAVGNRLVDRNGRVIYEAPNQQAAGFQGNGLEAQAHNVLLNGDPTSPIYAAAYSIVTKPQYVQEPNPNGDGTMIGAFRTPNVPYPPPGQQRAQAQPQGRPMIDGGGGGGQQAPYANQQELDAINRDNPNGAAGRSSPAAPMQQPPGPATSRDVNVNQPPELPPAVQRQPFRPGMTTEAIPGAQSTKPKPVSTEQQRIDAMIGEAYAGVNMAKDIIFDPRGAIDHGTLISMWANVPGTAGAEARQAFRAAMNNMVYLKTGAAATPSELENLEATYLPKPYEGDGVIRNKIKLFEQFIGSYQTTQQRGSTLKAQQSNERVIQYDAQGNRVQ